MRSFASLRSSVGIQVGECAVISISNCVGVSPNSVKEGGGLNSVWRTD
jgi:hypothetical protein